MVTRAKDGIHKTVTKYAFTTNLDHDLVEPTCFSQANKSSEWHKMMADEFNALQGNGMRTLVHFQSNMNIIPNKWVYKI